MHVDHPETAADHPLAILSRRAGGRPIFSVALFGFKEKMRHDAKRRDGREAPFQGQRVTMGQGRTSGACAPPGRERGHYVLPFRSSKVLVFTIGRITKMKRGSMAMGSLVPASGGIGPRHL
jgi:hypothetical protein